MATTRHRDDRADGPAGWMILLGLMVVALLLAWSSKGCGDDSTNSGNVTPTTTQATNTSANAGQTVVNEIQNLVTKSGGIQFTSGKTELTTGSKGVLDNVAKILGRNSTLNVQIEGHTDTQGDVEDNRSLSLRRANEVRDYLVTKGIAATRLSTRGFGEDQPLVPNDTTEAARQQNRRVEFKLSN